MRLDIVCRHKFSDSFAMDIDLSCQVRAMALFGHSGSGKTTILSAIAGIFAPKAGRIAIDEQVVLDTDKKLNLPPEKRSVGITPQHLHLFEHRTVRDNLEFGMPHRRKWKQNSAIICKQEIKFDAVVDVLELGSFLERYPAGLSGGEKQRVAVGRALLSQPRLLILDEPLSALDRCLKERLMGYLKKVIDCWHIPTIITTHNPAVVHDLADSVAVIHAGRIITIGSPAQILPESKNS